MAACESGGTVSVRSPNPRFVSPLPPATWTAPLAFFRMAAHRKRDVLSDDDAEPDGAGTSIASDTSRRRLSRKSKQDANKKWESLVPGRPRKRQKDNPPPSDNESEGDAASLPTQHKPKEKATANSDLVGDKSRSEPASNRFRRYRAQRIDPDASSGEEKRQHTDTTHSMKHSKTPSHAADEDVSEAGEHMPPKFRKAQTLKTVVDSDDAWDSQGEAHSEDRSSVEEESGEAEGSEDDDEGLEEMEKNPQALKKMFASETAHWVSENEDEPSSAPKSHSKASKRTSHGSSSHKYDTPAASHLKSQRLQSSDSDKKRPRHEHSGSERDVSAVPPAKKKPKDDTSHGGTHSQVAVTTATKSKRRPAPERATDETSKCASSKRADEIPKFRKSNDSVSNADRGPVKRKRQSADRGRVNSSSKLPPRKHTSQTDSDTGSGIDNVSSTDSDSVDSGIEIVYPRRGKLKLKEQHRRVRRVIHHGINTMLADVALKNAFPDGPEKQGEIVKRALLSAASHFAYDDISRRLRKEEDYADDLCKIPAQRIPTFRSQVRKLVEGQPCTAFGLTFGDKEKGDWLQEGFRYIYPFDYENKTIKVGKPYSPPVFLETLRVAFFKRPSSLGFRISEHFESSLPDKPDEKEIPAAMLALVATALYAAIEDCKHNRVQPRDFSSNDYWGVYKDLIQELSTIRTHGPVQFHVLMHGFWRRISTPMGTSGPSGGPRKSFLNVAAMDVEIFVSISSYCTPVRPTSTLLIFLLPLLLAFVILSFTR
ncbi:hypothetical protein VTO73DRAFT_15570 [Trametes versicolor]